MQNLYVSPAVQCEICEEMTHYAGYDRYRYKDKYQSYIEIQFIPRCAIHDYSESYTIAIQHRCIRRFIQAQLLEYATISHITPCDPKETTYQKDPDDHFPDYAWVMHYKSKNHDQAVYVVWSNDDIQFYLLGIEQPSL